MLMVVHPELAWPGSSEGLGQVGLSDHQHVNKYMIEFSEHATHTGGMMQLFMVSSIAD